MSHREVSFCHSMRVLVEESWQTFNLWPMVLPPRIWIWAHAFLHTIYMTSVQPTSKRAACMRLISYLKLLTLRNARGKSLLNLTLVRH